MNNLINRASLGAKKCLTLLLSSRLKNYFTLDYGSRMTRKWFGNDAGMTRFSLVSLICVLMLTLGVGNAWGTTLFHETFGNNTGSARAWNDSYSVKSGVSAVYSGITGYTISNCKQGKNTTGSTQSGLNQTTQGTDAYIIIGPLNVAKYSSLVLTYEWKAASTKETYTTELYYKTSSSGTFSEVSGTGTGATTFVTRTYNLPVAAEVSTLYLKIVWNTSNTQAIIDEVNLDGKCVVTYNGNGNTSGSVPTDATKYDIDASVTVKSNSGSLVKTGYTFDGWNTKADGTGADKAASATFTITQDTTLYAKWTAAVSCDAPNAPTKSSVSGTGVTISTTSAAANYDIYLSTSSTTPTTQDPTASTSSANSKVISDLSYGTTYYYWMRQNCGGGSTSSWVAGSPATFTTTVPAPTGVSAGSLSMTGATISITDANNVNSYDVYCSESSTAPVAGTTPSASGTSKSIAVTGLTAGREYYFWARAKGPNAKSDWVGGSTFTTLTLSSISVSTAPTKTKYLVGDNFDPTGLVITRTYSNSTSDTYTYSGHTTEFSFSPATNTALTDDDDKVTITYGGKTVDQSINVYTVTVSMVNMSGTAISNASVTASCSGRTLSQSVGSTNYKFNSWNVTAGGVSVSDNEITGTPTGDVTINAKFHDPITVTWKVGTGAASGSPTDEVKYGTAVTALPTTPADNALSSCGTNKFMGWSASELKGTGYSAPSDLFTAASGAANLTTNTTYRAVFASSTSGAAANTVLFSENWKDVTASTQPSSPTANGSVVYGSASVSYSWYTPTDGSTSQTYTTDGPNSNENILISKKNGYWKVTGIPSGSASKIVFTYAKSGSGTLSVSSPTSNVTVGGSSSGSYITFTDEVETFDLEFKNTNNSNNLRLDDIVVKVYTAGTTYSNYQTGCCEAPASSLSITSANSVATGGTVTLTSTGGNGGTVTWSVTAGTGTASISAGVLTGGTVGTVTVKAHQDANTVSGTEYCAQDAEQTFTVVASTVYVTGVTVAPTSKAIVVGETFTITPTISPSNATDKSVSWKSSASDKASVSSGTVTGVAKGSATITCTTTDGSKTAETSVTVYDFSILAQDEDGTDISGVTGISASHTGKSLIASVGSTNYVFKTWKYATGGQGGLDAISSATSTSTTLTGTPTGDVTVIAEFYKPLIVNWSVNGDVTETTVPYDGAVTALPTAPTSSDCDYAKVFVGWRADEISGISTSNPGDIFNAVGDVPDLDNVEETTFYAVFADRSGGDNTLITDVSELTAGTKVYIYAATSDAPAFTAVAKAFESGNNVRATTGSVSSNKLTPGEGACAYTIGTATYNKTDGYTFNDGTCYLRATGSDKNYLVGAAALGDDGYGVFTITITSGVFAISSIGNTSRGVMQFNKNGDTGEYDKALFACYASASNTNVQLFKKNPYVYSNYVTTCTSCDADATFTTAKPVVSEIDCESATLTAIGGLATLGATGCNVGDYGFVIGTADNPAIGGSGVTKLQVGTSNPTLGDDFSYDVTDLTKGTRYYIRAYARNKHGIAYSSSQNFYTLEVSSIAVTESPRTKYIAGETFDASGMSVTATMVGGDEADVTEDVTYSSSALTSGTNQDFTITYTLCEDEVTATQKIDVYTLTVTEGTNESYGSVSTSANVITVTPNSGKIGVPVVTSENAEIVDNNDNTYTIVNPTGNVAVTINYRDAAATVVHYYVNGVEITSLKGTPTEGSSFDLPNASAVATAIAAQGVSTPDPTNYPNFWGWSRTAVHAQCTEPTVLNGSAKVYTETSFHAVYTNMSKIRIDESLITSTSYPGSESNLTAGGLTDGFKYHYILKNSTNLQFKKNNGYLYNQTSISGLRHVNIGASGNTDNISVFACSAAGTKTGSALSDANTRDDAYVYNMPTSTTYFKVEAGNDTYYINYIDIYYSSGSAEELYMTTFKSVFNPAGASGNWSDVANWEDGVLPTIKDAVTIKKPVTVNVTNAKAKSILLDQNSKTGKLVISAGKALAVAETIKKTTDGSTEIATAENDIVIESNGSNGTGALVAGSESTDTKATVQFYSKAKKDGGGKYINQYFGTPFASASKLNYYGSYLRKFDVATDKWVSFTEESNLNAWTAYRIMREETSEGTYDVGGTLVLPGTTTHKDKVLTLTKGAADHTDNMFANSWIAPIDVTKFDATTDFTGAVATIYVFNAGSSSDGTNTYANKDAGAGNWNAMPVAAVKAAVAANPSQTTYDLTQIPSQQAFLVQTDGSGGTYTLKLDYKKLVYDPIATNGATIIPTRAPKRTMDAEVELMQLKLTGESGLQDRVLMYISDDFSTDELDNGWEAYKLAGSAFAPQICANTPLGEMAISATDEIEGTVLGFYAGTEDGNYTFSFEYNGEEMWYLNDLDAKSSTPISNERTYRFTATRGTATETRFTISKSPIVHMPTGVDNGESEIVVRKLLIHDNLYIIREGRMYNAEGILVK